MVMSGRTYLQHCLNKNGLLCRWPDGAMPIHVYIAPFTWYEKKKQQESMTYRQMVLDSLNAWQRVAKGKVRFLIVDSLNNSQIDFKWRRVDRKSLGHCTYEIDDKCRLFSASIQIGISDGLLHAEYQDAGEVQHTILHEIGHALGLSGHSDEPDDIMYVPHQYGVHTLSPRDVETLHWLYKLPVGFNYKAIGEKFKIAGGFTFNRVIDTIAARETGEELPDEVAAAPTPEEPQRRSSVLRTQSLDEQHQILSEMGRFHLKTQNIRVNLKHPPPRKPPE